MPPLSLSSLCPSLPQVPALQKEIYLFFFMTNVTLSLSVLEGKGPWSFITLPPAHSYLKSAKMISTFVLYPRHGRT